MEGRDDMRQESQMPPDPLPSRFSDWSSLGSPHTRTSPHGVPDREVEQNGNIPNQLSVQSGTVPRQETIRAGSQEEVIIPPQRNQQVEEQNVLVMEMEPNPLNIEVIAQRDGRGTDRESTVPTTQPSGNVVLPIGIGESTPGPNVNMESENNTSTSRGSHVRIQENLMILPVERLTLSRDQRMISENVRTGQNYPHEGTCLPGTSTSNRRDYPEDSSDDNRSYRGRMTPQ